MQLSALRVINRFALVYTQPVLHMASEVDAVRQPCLYRVIVIKQRHAASIYIVPPLLLIAIMSACVGEPKKACN